RTRQVRLSDLMKLSPVLDVEAAISTEIGRLDLPAIPRQFEVLREYVQTENATLAEQIGTLASQLEQFITEARQIWVTRQEQLDALGQRDEQMQQAIQQAEATITTLQQDLPQIRQALIE